MGSLKKVLTLAALMLASVGSLTACGGSDSPVVSRVGDMSVTRASVSHWMEVLVAGDYRAELIKVAPVGLVSDPPKYGACIRAAEKVVPKRAPEVTAKICRELYSAVKRQAVTFLLDAAWHKADAKEHGEVVNAKAIASELASLRAREWPKPGEFQKYLLERHLSVADESYLLERNLLSQRLLARLLLGRTKETPVAYARLADAYTAKWRTRTHCADGYVTEQCSEYKAGEDAGQSPNNILLRLAEKKVGPSA